ncbi:MAG TPA: hydroxymethylbilane synthase [Chitinophagales bacterium]|nr:hydroxymethylbilane synthase [Chitinophagales bacterium]
MKGKSTPIIIGTRGSELALWQANFTKSVLEENGLLVEIKIIKTKGDATQQWNLSFDKIEGKGFFTKELEDALLAKEIDLAVHSCKDLPTAFPDGLTVAAYSKRANPFDKLIIRKECVDERKLLNFKDKAVVGTSSARRKAQLLALRPDVEIHDLRGNVPTRVNYLREGKYDAIILAAAGLERLNIDLSEFVSIPLQSPQFIPAPAQGVLAFQIREDDTVLFDICQLLKDKESTVIASIERQVLHDFHGGCQIPLGVFAQQNEQNIDVWISHATAWNEIPKRMHTIFNGDTIAQQSANVVRQLSNFKAKSVFISSDLSDDDYIIRVLKSHHIPVSYQSFIEFNAIAFTMPTQADWLFFSSKNGVNFFYNNVSMAQIENCKIAAINQGTASAIHQLGYKTDFIGKGNDLLQIAKEFDAIADGKIVFPQAKTSMQSIQKNMSSNKISETLVVYENLAAPSIAERHEDILVFTSPLSVEAYMSSCSLQSNQTIISIGNTTTKRLNSFGVTEVKTAFEPSYLSVLDEIFAVE